MECLKLYNEYENSNGGRYYDTQDEKLINLFRDNPHLLKNETLFNIYISLVEDNSFLSCEPKKQALSCI
jgi:hypothetical protein